MPKCYLAGPVTGSTYDECTGWRDYATKVLTRAGIQAFSPMRAKGYLNAGPKRGCPMQDAYGSGREEPGTHVKPLSSSMGIVTRDRHDVMTCDMLLVNFLGAWRVSIGTCVELGWADAFRKPVVLVMEGNGSNVHEHAFVRELAGFVCHTLEEGIALVETILLPDEPLETLTPVDRI